MSTLEGKICDIMKTQQEQIESQHQQMAQICKLVESLTKAKDTSEVSEQSNQKLAPEALMESLSNAMIEFNFDQDNGQTFGNWYSRYEDIFKEDGKALDDKARVRLLLRKINPIAYAKYADYILPKAPRDMDFKETVKTLNTIFGQAESIFCARYNCLQTIKNENDDFISYAAIVNKRCESFKITDFSVDQLKCLVFVMGLKSPSNAELRTRLLNMLDNETTEAPLNVEKLIAEIQRIQELKSNSNLIETRSSSVNKIYHNKKKYNSSMTNNKEDQIPKTPCWKCGAMHFYKNCSYANHQCKKCKKVGHKEGYCFTPSSSRPANKTKSSKAYKNNKITQSAPQKRQSTEPQASQQGSLHSQSKKKKHYNQSQSVSSISCVNHLSTQQNRKNIDIQINQIKVTLQIDTGSDISIISKKTWIKLGKPKLQNSELNVKDASAKQIKFLGELTCSITLETRSVSHVIYISNFNHLNLFGNDLMNAFELWERPINTFCKLIAQQEIQERLESIKKQFSSIFNESVGHCNTFMVNLPLKPTAHPIFIPKRPVAYSALAAVEKELNRLENAGIITPVNYSSWAAPIVVVKRANGKIRICADYSTGLNDQVEAHQYPLPNPEDIFTKMINCKVFTKIDLSDAYMQIEVSEETKKILTINTHKGLYTFNRLAPGIKSAPGAFQQVMDNLFSNMVKVSPYLDDIMIATETQEENYSTVIEVLKRLQEHNFTVNWEKCNFFVNTIKYLGFIVNCNGRSPDPDKIEIIKKMPAPSNISELRSYLGAVNYYGKFIDKMKQLRAPLDQLLKNDQKYIWSQNCQDSFEQFKSILSSNLLLAHYNPKLPIVVAADASNVGVGARISHVYPDGSEKAVYHASRSLTAAEKNYSQIEKEGLALVFAVTKFHKMIYGRSFTLQTDHKPLLSIFGSKKGIPAHTANRLQRWALTLMLYDFRVQYISTKDFGYVDVLSRLISQQVKNNEDYVVATMQLENDLDSILQENIQYLPVTYNMVQKFISVDHKLKMVKQFLLEGWPEKSKINKLILPFYCRKDNLCIFDNCLLYRGRLVIPEILKKKVLKQLHKGHQGMERMKLIARSYVYWPEIDKDIEHFVKSCQNCSCGAKTSTKATLSSWSLSSRPMERVHIDIAGPLKEKYYFVIVDSFSRYPEIVQTSTISSSAITTLFSQYCSHFGQPQLVVSDNGTQFTSTNFKDFCRQRGIQHTTIAPYHPQSNGLAERFVDTFKRALSKIKTNNNDFDNLQEFLLAYRSTPNKNNVNNSSPAELFLGRKIATNIDLLLKPMDIVNNRNASMEKYYNQKHGAKHRFFNNNDLVFVKQYQTNKWSWVPGVVKKKIGTVMYEIQVNNKSIRSHINQLRSRQTPSRSSSSSRSSPSSRSSSTMLSSSTWVDILFDVFELTPTYSKIANNNNDSSNDHPSNQLLPASPNEININNEANSSNEYHPINQANYQLELTPSIRRSSRKRGPPKRFC